MSADTRPSFTIISKAENDLGLTSQDIFNLTKQTFPYFIRNTYLDFKNPQELSPDELICVPLTDTLFPLYALMPRTEFKKGKIYISPKSTRENIIFNHRGGSTEIWFRKEYPLTQPDLYSLYTQYCNNPDGNGGGWSDIIGVLKYGKLSEIGPFDSQFDKGVVIFLGLAGLRESQKSFFSQSNFIALVLT